MGQVSDAEAAQRLAELLKTMPQDSVAQALEHGRRLSADWRAMSAAELVLRLRRRFDMTQRQLAALAGLPHSKVNKVESGQDVRLSTLRRLFAGFGCGLAIVPVCRLSAEELWRRTHELAGEGRIGRRRRYSRR